MNTLYDTACRVSVEDRRDPYFDEPEGWTEAKEQRAVDIIQFDDERLDQLVCDPEVSRLIRELESLIPSMQRVGKRVESTRDLLSLDGVNVRCIADKAIELICCMENKVLENCSEEI
jgi:hypothetical protein